MERHFEYRPHGVCSSLISFDIEDGNVKNIRFVNGCPGNTQGVGRLAEGQPVEEVIEKIKGIQCRNGTSCPDQLSKALESALVQMGK